MRRNQRQSSPVRKDITRTGWWTRMQLDRCTNCTVDEEENIAPVEDEVVGVLMGSGVMSVGYGKWLYLENWSQLLTCSRYLSTNTYVYRAVTRQNSWSCCRNVYAAVRCQKVWSCSPNLRAAVIRQKGWSRSPNVYTAVRHEEGIHRRKVPRIFMPRLGGAYCFRRVRSQRKSVD